MKMGKKKEEGNETKKNKWINTEINKYWNKYWNNDSNTLISREPLLTEWKSLLKQDSSG